MKKSGSNTPKETPEQELKRLRKENSKAKVQKEADKAKINDLKKELKKVHPTFGMMNYNYDDHRDYRRQLFCGVSE